MDRLASGITSPSASVMNNGLCVLPIVEIAAVKFVALTRRAGAKLASVQGERDPTLIRRVYDLHAIRAHYDPAEVAALAREVMQSDAEIRDHEFPRYGADPLAETLRAVAGIAASKENTRPTTLYYSETHCTEQRRNIHWQRTH
jgi:hypothetical protein